MNTRILSNVLRSLFLPLFIALQAGCSPILVVKAEGEVPPPALHDGLSASPAPLIMLGALAIGAAALILSGPLTMESK